MLETIFFLAGAIFGSFFNLCIYRLPRDISIITPGSFCPACGHKIRWYDNIPIISWILLFGRCRDCQELISIRYIIIEILTGLLFLFLSWFCGLNKELFIWLFFFSLLLLISVIDIETFFVLDRVVYPGIIVGVILSFFLWKPIEHIIGMLLGGGIIFLLVKLSPKLLGKKGMGEGDVGVALLLGIFLGWKLMLSTLLISSILGIAIGGTILLLTKRTGSYIPYVPYLAAGGFISWVLSQKIEAFFTL
ncbi:prepilin peptidase [bacterium]|nr:prepilin peptidase [bacterium]MBU1598686.1 prepilin peptidase [bacterium]MBU2461553.1 prepilin peptidase [bacterium]